MSGELIGEHLKWIETAKKKAAETPQKREDVQISSEPIGECLKWIEMAKEKAVEASQNGAGCASGQ